MEGLCPQTWVPGLPRDTTLVKDPCGETLSLLQVSPQNTGKGTRRKCKSFESIEDPSTTTEFSAVHLQGVELALNGRKLWFSGYQLGSLVHRSHKMATLFSSVNQKEGTFTNPPITPIQARNTEKTSQSTFFHCCSTQGFNT